MKIAALILAAGGSRRLGRPKQLVRFGDEPLLARVIHAASTAGAHPLIVVLGESVPQIQEGVDLSGCKVVLNAEWIKGVASSIHAGLQAIETESAEVNGVLMLVCDQPRLSADHLRSMIDSFVQHGAKSIIASTYGDTRGTLRDLPASRVRQAL